MHLDVHVGSAACKHELHAVLYVTGCRKLALFNRVLQMFAGKPELEIDGCPMLLQILHEKSKGNAIF
jgi:hypothetical protein